MADDPWQLISQKDRLEETTSPTEIFAVFKELNYFREPSDNHIGLQIKALELGYLKIILRLLKRYNDQHLQNAMLICLINLSTNTIFIEEFKRYPDACGLILNFIPFVNNGLTHLEMEIVVNALWFCRHIAWDSADYREIILMSGVSFFY